MNAYELADWLYLWCDGKQYPKENLLIVEMLRHQADYIVQLEKGLESSIAMNKAQVDRIAELERKHKEEFEYVENLLKAQ
tara:strand:+ start:143 stop:382 length:240 start_codon:yes stop_codon:yes gene_type:complete